MFPSLLIMFFFPLLAVSHEERDGTFDKAVTFQTEILCHIPKRWCGEITFYTATKVRGAPLDRFLKDTAFYKNTFCARSSEANPIFDNTMVPFRNELGGYVSYQLQHNCSKDGKPDCLDVSFATYIQRDDSFIRLFGHDIGTGSGQGKCPDLMPSAMFWF